MLTKISLCLIVCSIIAKISYGQTIAGLERKLDGRDEKTGVNSNPVDMNLNSNQRAFRNNPNSVQGPISGIFGATNVKNSMKATRTGSNRLVSIAQSGRQQRNQNNQRDNESNQGQQKPPGFGLSTGGNLGIGGEMGMKMGPTGLISKLSEKKACFGNGGPITIIIQTPAPATTAASG